MEKTLAIWKFPLEVTDISKVEMPEGSKVLTVQTQRETPCIWALVNTTARTVVRSFRVCGTGHPLEDEVKDYPYVGTFQLQGGALIFHVFQL